MIMNITRHLAAMVIGFIILFTALLVALAILTLLFTFPWQIFILAFLIAAFSWWIGSLILEWFYPVIN